MTKKKVTKEMLDELIEKFVSHAEEERDLALERYRRQDEMMTTPEDFVLQGKNTVEYLKTASERSNSLLNVAKMIKDIVYAKNESVEDDKEMTDDDKKEIIKAIRESGS
jgi:translation initiation factor 2B subunit (eIF-2B alpha/beta/delta family)